MVLYHLNTGIMCSKLLEALVFGVMCCDILRWVDTPSKNSYQETKRLAVSEIELEQARGTNP